MRVGKLTMPQQVEALATSVAVPDMEVAAKQAKKAKLSGKKGKKGK